MTFNEKKENFTITEESLKDLIEAILQCDNNWKKVCNILKKMKK